MGEFVVLGVDELRVALPLSSVERVVRAVCLTPVPHAPRVVLGIINVGGRILPVISLRARLGLPDKPVTLTDQFLIVQTSQRSLALIADAAIGMVHRQPGELVAADRILPGLAYIEGIIKLDDGLILVHDPERFLSVAETTALNLAMSIEQEAGHAA